MESASAGTVDVDREAGAARRAFPSGPRPAISPAQRSHLIWKLGQAIEAAADELAPLETLNTGKPLGTARASEITGAAEAFRYNAGWATKLNGETRNVSLAGEWHAYTLREAIGVVGLIVPWNSPLAITAAKLAPALTAGYTVVLKPAELTPLTAVRLRELALEVGCPPAVLNIVQRLGAVAGQRIADHPLVDKISFTGSTAVGKHLLASCAVNRLRALLHDLDQRHFQGPSSHAGSRRAMCGSTPQVAWMPNMPFAGLKQSGWGKENGREGVEAYTEVKSAAINISGV